MNELVRIAPTVFKKIADCIKCSHFQACSAARPRRALFVPSLVSVAGEVVGGEGMGRGEREGGREGYKHHFRNSSSARTLSR